MLAMFTTWPLLVWHGPKAAFAEVVWACVIILPILIVTFKIAKDRRLERVLHEIPNTRIIYNSRK